MSRAGASRRSAGRIGHEAGRAPGRAQAGPDPPGGSSDVLVGRGVVMSLLEAMEFASYAVTVIGLPFAIGVFLWEQRHERENEDEEGYQLLSDAYNDFLKVVLDNA